MTCLHKYVINKTFITNSHHYSTISTTTMVAGRWSISSFFLKLFFTSFFPVCAPFFLLWYLLKGFCLKVTQNGEIPRGRTVSDSSELRLSHSAVLKPGFFRSFGSVLFSPLTPAFVLHPLWLSSYIKLEFFFFLITDWSQGIFLKRQKLLL